MAKKKEDKPVHGIPVKTYAEFRRYIQRFAEGKFPFLMIIGSTSIGKTETIKEVIPKSIVCDGTLSAFEFFKALGGNLDWTFVLDDLPPKCYRDEMLSLLKALTNSTSTSPDGNVVRYTKASVDPQSFTTKTRVILLANSWENIDPNVKALEARGITLLFNPTNYEVHKQVANWFHNQEVYDYMYESLPLIGRNQMRFYTTAAQLKRAGMDWKTALLGMFESDKAEQVLLQLQNQEMSHRQRAAEFARLLGCSPRTYWRIKKRLEVGAPKIIGPNLKLKPKPKTPKSKGHQPENGINVPALRR